MKSPFTHNYGKTPIVEPKTVKASAAERTAKLIAPRRDGITIPTKDEEDHSKRIAGRRVGI